MSDVLTELHYNVSIVSLHILWPFDPSVRGEFPLIVLSVLCSLSNLGLLFHRALLMSGSGLAPWSLVGDPAYYAAAVANHVNCSPDLPFSHLMKCLRERPLEALLSTTVRPPEFGNAFGPSVDGVVIGK